MIARRYHSSAVYGSLIVLSFTIIGAAESAAWLMETLMVSLLMAVFGG